MLGTVNTAVISGKIPSCLQSLPPWLTTEPITCLPPEFCQDRIVCHPPENMSQRHLVISEKDTKKKKWGKYLLLRLENSKEAQQARPSHGGTQLPQLSFLNAVVISAIYRSLLHHKRDAYVHVQGTINTHFQRVDLTRDEATGIQAGPLSHLLFNVFIEQNSKASVQLAWLGQGSSGQCVQCPLTRAVIAVRINLQSPR